MLLLGVLRVARNLFSILRFLRKRLNDRVLDLIEVTWSYRISFAKTGNNLGPLKEVGKVIFSTIPQDYSWPFMSVLTMFPS